MALDHDVLVPGHGDPMRDHKYLEALDDLLGTLIDQVREGVLEGQAPETILESLDLTSFTETYVGDDPRQLAGFDAFFRQPALAIFAPRVN